MLRYSSELALQGITKQLRTSIVVICILALGVGAATAMQAVFRAMGGDPIPEKSSTLYYPKLNPLPISYQDATNRKDAPDVNLTWPDAKALIDSQRADAQAAMAGGNVVVALPDGGASYVRSRFATSEFFRLFDLAFEEGRPWSKEEEANRARIAVITDVLASTMFPGGASTGESILIDDIPFVVVGVVKEWRPWPKFYADLSSSAFSEADQLFIPLETALDVGAQVSGTVSTWGPEVSSSEMLTSPSATWLQVWVELADEAAATEYSHFLRSYADEQRSRGVYERAAESAELVPLRNWLARMELIPLNVTVQLWLAYAFLIVCTVNTSALLLARFQARGASLAIRRALGAKKSSIVLQLTIEAAALGALGGLFAIPVCELGLWIIRRQPDDYAASAYLDPSMAVVAITLGIVSGVAAASVPAYKVSAEASIRRLM